MFCEMKTLDSLSFDNLIIYLIPGFEVTYSMRWVSEFLDTSLSQLSTAASGSIGLTIVLLIIALTCGLLVGTVRFALFEASPFVRRLVFGRDLRANYDDLTEAGWRTVKEVTSNVYNFAQFFENMFVALVIFCIFALIPDEVFATHPVATSLPAIGVLIALFTGYRTNIISTYKHIENASRDKPNISP